MKSSQGCGSLRLAVPNAESLPPSLFESPSGPHLDALEHPFTLPRGDREMVDEVAVEIGDLQQYRMGRVRDRYGGRTKVWTMPHFASRQLLQLRNAPNADHFLAVVTTEWKAVAIGAG